MSEGGVEKKNDECVKVVVRCRPFNKKEQHAGNTNIVQVDRDVSAIRVYKPGETNEPPKYVQWRCNNCGRNSVSCLARVFRVPCHVRVFYVLPVLHVVIMIIRWGKAEEEKEEKKKEEKEHGGGVVDVFAWFTIAAV